jgi:hypothetical protein
MVSGTPISPKMMMASSAKSSLIASIILSSRRSFLLARRFLIQFPILDISRQDVDVALLVRATNVAGLGGANAAAEPTSKNRMASNFMVIGGKM